MAHGRTQHTSTRTAPSTHVGPQSARDTKLIFDNESAPPAVACAGDSDVQVLPIIWNTDAGGRVTEVLGTGLDQVGWRVDRIIGKTLAEVFQTDDENYPALAAHRLALTGQTIGFEFTWGGRTFHGQARPLFNAGGALVGTVCAAHDISDLKRVREECRRLKEWIKTASQNDSLRKFAGGVAHKLNNMLTAMIGNAALAREGLPLDSPVQDRLRQVETVGHCMADVTGQVLLYARRTRPILDPLDVGALIEELDLATSSCVPSKISVEYALSPDMPAIPGDRPQLRRVITSLFANAVEAIGDSSGVIVIRARAIDANRAFLKTAAPNQSLPEGPYISLEVSDTGCGMDEETRKRIFEPFFSSKFTGRGLGLSAAEGIVHQHRGAIWAVSRPGRGTILHVLLPCKNAA
jgi:PAS domain S-box-containing protein